VLAHDPQSVRTCACGERVGGVGERVEVEGAGERRGGGEREPAGEQW